MKTMTSLVGAAILGMAASLQPALAAESWLACKGTLTTTPYRAAAGTNAESSRVLVADDTARQLFQWQEARKTLSLIPTQTYTAATIAWANAATGGTVGPRWKGTLDRTKMTLTIERTDGNLEHMRWHETCQPTQPRDRDASVAAAQSVTRVQ